MDRRLTSPRLTLEPIEPRHAELLFDLLQESSIYTYMPTEPPHSIAALQHRYEVLARRRSPDGRELWLNWAVQVTESCAYVGTVQATVRGDTTAHLAYELGSAFRGVGYATEACRAVMAELVARHSVEAVIAQIDTRNDGSIRLVERLGFTRAAHVEAADYFKGASSDEYEYHWHPR